MKAALHYIFLVGIPVIIVLILLRVGENTLTVPESVGGNWQLEFSTNPQSASCFGFTFGATEPILNISQSGPHLVLTFNDDNRTKFNGTLKELTVLANSQTSSNSTTPDMSLSLTINTTAEPDQFEGIMTQTSCEETWIISATRQPVLDQTSSGGH